MHRLALINYAIEQWDKNRNRTMETNTVPKCDRLSEPQTDMISRIVLAASNDPCRYQLCGVYIHGDNGNTYACAADGTILAVADLHSEWVLESKGFIVPTKALKRRRVTDIYLSDNGRIEVHYPSSNKTFDAIDGLFPDYWNAIAPSFEYAEPTNFRLADFDPHYVNLVAKILQTNDEEQEPITLLGIQRKESGPAIFYKNGVFVALMPLDWDDSKNRHATQVQVEADKFWTARER